MLIDICLSIIAAAIVALVVILVRISFQAKKSMYLLQNDIHNLSIEMTHLLNGLNEFVRADLRQVSQQTSQLIDRLNSLSADINDKSHSLNFLFKPLHFLNDKIGSDSSTDESQPKSETIPQIARWISSGMSLIKTTKEFFKNGK